MSEKNQNPFKYGLLRLLDVSGFTVLDPIVRLVYNEEPRKQIKAILNFLVIPILFILCCFSLWFFIAPKHKTKSGEVPTPDMLIDSAVINHTFDRREIQKGKDFALTGTKRDQTIEIVERNIASLSSQQKALNEELKKIEKDYQEVILANQLAPYRQKIDSKQTQYNNTKAAHKEQISLLSKQVAGGMATSDQLIATLREHTRKESEQKTNIRLLKAEMDTILSEKYKPLEEARLKVNAVSDELLFLRKRQEMLQDKNRAIKIAKMEETIEKYKVQIEQEPSAAKKLLLAKKIIRTQDSIGRLEQQTYAPAVTIYQQIRRSLFTVILGFLMAAVVALPLGIMCGLNRVVMACITPIVSLFRPVSPVVWLLIFQIIVGAFFPDPDNHPLFLFFDSIPLLRSLQINPALIFSACTVAMCAVWPSLVNTALGVASIDPDFINVARVLRLGFFSQLFKIIIPSALPLAFAGLRISLGVGWMVLIAAEALSSSDGLGKFVWDEYQNGSSYTFSNILFACFVIGFIGFCLDRVMIVLQRLVSFDGSAGSI